MGLMLGGPRSLVELTEINYIISPPPKNGNLEYVPHRNLKHFYNPQTPREFK